MIKLKNVSKYYKTKDSVTQALHNINLTFERGEFIAVVGESGSGKSTLLNVISGLDTYEDGELFIEGKETSYYEQHDWEEYRKHYIGFVFQEFNIIDAYSVYDNVFIALTIQGYDKAKREARTLELIDKVGLSSHVHHKASKLSGGQKQRVSIARALAKDAPIIVADEPTGNLDSETAKTILALLKEISKDKLVLLVTHSFDRIKDFATRSVRLFDGEVVEDKSLRAGNIHQDNLTFKDYKVPFSEKFFIALKNIFSMPKKTGLILAMSMFIVSIFTLTYGAFIEQTYAVQGDYHPNFSNVNQHRLVVSKNDLSTFTEEEIEDLEGLEHVRRVIHHDPVFDVNATIFIENPRFVLDYNQAFKLFHAESLDARDIKDGRMPEAMNEVVMADSNEFEIGDKLSILIGAPREDNEMIEFELVGFTREETSSNQSRKIYFHQEFFEDDKVIREALMRYHDFELGVLDWVYRLTNNDIVIDNTLNEDEIVVVPGAVTSFMNAYNTSPPLTEQEFLDSTFDLTARSSFYPKHEAFEVEILRLVNPIEAQYFEGRLAMNINTLNNIIDYNPYQITLLVYDSFDAYRTLDSIDTSRFDPVFPADYESEDPVIRILFQFLQGVSSVFLLTVMYFVSYLTLKNIMVSRQKDFIILRSIGASKKDLNRIVILELLMIMALAFVLVYALLTLNNALQTALPNYLRYFEWTNYLFMIVALTLLSIFLGRKFNKKLFEQSIITAFKGSDE